MAPAKKTRGPKKKLKRANPLAYMIMTNPKARKSWQKMADESGMDLSEWVRQTLANGKVIEEAITTEAEETEEEEATDVEPVAPVISAVAITALPVATPTVTPVVSTIKPVVSTIANGSSSQNSNHDVEVDTDDVAEA